MLTEFGKKVRKARIDAGVTMMDMAAELSSSPAFLSGIETGRKKVPAEWVPEIENYFLAKGVRVTNLGEAADASNKTVSLEGLSRQHQMLIAGFARVQSSAFTDEDIEKFKELLEGLQGEKK